MTLCVPRILHLDAIFRYARKTGKGLSTEHHSLNSFFNALAINGKMGGAWFSAPDMILSGVRLRQFDPLAGYLTTCSVVTA